MHVCTVASTLWLFDLFNWVFKEGYEALNSVQQIFRMNSEADRILVDETDKQNLYIGTKRWKPRKIIFFTHCLSLDNVRTNGKRAHIPAGSQAVIINIDRKA